MDFTSPALSPEWLETDGLGGSAPGTALGIPARRYHAFYITNSGGGNPRTVLLSGIEASLVKESGARFALTSFYYEPGVVFPEGARAITKFSSLPWPVWEFSV